MRTSLRTPRGVITAAAVVAALAAGTAGGVALADDSAVKALSPHAQASAWIRADGSRAQSQGIASVTKPDVGVYCVRFDDATRIQVGRSTPQATLSLGSQGKPWGSSVLVAAAPTAACGNATDALTVLTGGPNGPLDHDFVLAVP
jgi:hypothetical protein